MSGCKCIKCLDDGWAPNPEAASIDDMLPPSRRRMVVCSTCGNKRCQHATDHNLTCTGSNETGQPGSIYA